MTEALSTLGLILSRQALARSENTLAWNLLSQPLGTLTQTRYGSALSSHRASQPQPLTPFSLGQHIQKQLLSHPLIAESGLKTNPNIGEHPVPSTGRLFLSRLKFSALEPRYDVSLYDLDSTANVPQENTPDLAPPDIQNLTDESIPSQSSSTLNEIESVPDNIGNVTDNVARSIKNFTSEDISRSISISQDRALNNHQGVEHQGAIDAQTGLPSFGLTKEDSQPSLFSSPDGNLSTPLATPLIIPKAYSHPRLISTALPQFSKRVQSLINTLDSISPHLFSLKGDGGSDESIDIPQIHQVDLLEETLESSYITPEITDFSENLPPQFSFIQRQPQIPSRTDTPYQFPLTETSFLRFAEPFTFGTVEVYGEDTSIENTNIANVSTQFSSVVPSPSPPKAKILQGSQNNLQQDSNSQVYDLSSDMGSESGIDMLQLFSFNTPLEKSNFLETDTLQQSQTPRITDAIELAHDTQQHQDLSSNNLYSRTSKIGNNLIPELSIIQPKRPSIFPSLQTNLPDVNSSDSTSVLNQARQASLKQFLLPKRDRTPTLELSPSLSKIGKAVSDTSTALPSLLNVTDAVLNPSSTLPQHHQAFSLGSWKYSDNIPNLEASLPFLEKQVQIATELEDEESAQNLPYILNNGNSILSEIKNNSSTQPVLPIPAVSQMEPVPMVSSTSSLASEAKHIRQSTASLTQPQVQQSSKFVPAMKALQTPLGNWEAFNRYRQPSAPANLPNLNRKGIESLLTSSDPNSSLMPSADSTSPEVSPNRTQDSSVSIVPRQWESIEDLINSRSLDISQEEWSEQFQLPSLPSSNSISESIQKQIPDVAARFSEMPDVEDEPYISNALDNLGEDVSLSRLTLQSRSVVRTNDSIANAGHPQLTQQADTTPSHEMLEMIARAIYKRLRDRILIEQERRGHSIHAPPSWTVPSTSVGRSLSEKKSSSGVSHQNSNPFSSCIYELTQTSYLYLMQRIASDQERYQ
jgi:hypothetical protein